MSKQPNELFVVLIRARNLKPQNRKHDQSKQADPFVRTELRGQGDAIHNEEKAT